MQGHYDGYRVEQILLGRLAERRKLEAVLAGGARRLDGHAVHRGAERARWLSFDERQAAHLGRHRPHHRRRQRRRSCELCRRIESNGVFSRDRRGIIYSRRMVDDARKRRTAAKNGAKGGNPSLLKQKAIPPPDKGEDKAGVIPLSQSPEAKTPDSKSPDRSPFEDLQRLIARAAQAMGVTVEELRRRPKWIVFADFLSEMALKGCDLERDVWPTIERVARRAKCTPDSPQYFRAEILAAREVRLAALTAKPASAVEQADRLAVFERHGVWSSQWGPKPEK